MTLYSFDEEYLRRLKDGDPSVEEHFYSYFRELLTIKLQRQRDRDLVADVIQDTFSRVLTAVTRGAIEKPERFGSFVNSTAENVLKEKIRQDSRHPSVRDEGPVRADPGPDPLALFIDEERKRQVRDLLAKLSAKDSSLIREIIYKGRDKEDVAKELRVRPTYLRVLLHRAIRHMTQEYHRQYGAGA